MTVYLETVDLTHEAAYFEWEMKGYLPYSFFLGKNYMQTTVHVNEDYVLGIF